MNGRLGKKWLAVAVIWGVVLAMTGWNIHLVGQVQSRRRELGTLQMDLRFVRAHHADILDMRGQQSRLVHAVPSFGLGFLVVENDLKRLSRDFGLQQVRVDAEENFHDSRPVPISMVGSGPVPAIVGWLAAVEEACPYLVVQRMDITTEERSGQCRLQATFNYRFTLAETERAG